MRAAVIIDMYGCPNRCRHCWLGHGPDARVPKQDFINICEAFRRYHRDGKLFFSDLIVKSWYREPDYHESYRELHDLETALSTEVPPPNVRERASVWRLARDPSYAPWLKSIGIERVQVTLFGTEATTDRYTGRTGAYGDSMRAIEALLGVGIAPKIQLFPLHQTINDVIKLLLVLRDLRLRDRVRELGEECVCFIDIPAPLGEGFEMEDVRLTEGDLKRLPRELLKSTAACFGATGLAEIWNTEAGWLRTLRGEDEPLRDIPDPVTFLVTPELNVYPSEGEIKDWWWLGNIAREGIDGIVTNFLESNAVGLRMNREVPVGWFAERWGDAGSDRLWSRSALVHKWFRLEAMDRAGLL